MDVVGDAEVVAFGVDGNAADDGDADDVAVVVPLGVGVEGLSDVGTTPVSVAVVVGSDILITFAGRGCLYSRVNPSLQRVGMFRWVSESDG